MTILFARHFHFMANLKNFKDLMDEKLAENIFLS